MAKFTKKNKKNKSTPLLIGAAVLLTIALVLMIWVIHLLNQSEIPVLPWAQTTQPVQTTIPALPPIPTEGEEEADNIKLNGGLEITRLGGYAGIFMEDGSDEVVADVMMIILKNTSDQDLQLARINLNYSDFVAKFEATNLAAGESVVLLEKNRHPSVAEEYLSAEAENVVFFQEAMSLQEDKITVTGGNGYLEVTNISGTDITGEIFVYYKNSASDLFYGGITYRARFGDGLAAGETSRVLTGHYNPTNCTIVMVTCGE